MRRTTSVGAAGTLLAALVLGAGSASASGEPLAELGARLGELRDESPLRLEVEVEQKHRGSAPLHLRRTRQRGGAVIEWGPRGVESLEQWWFGGGTRVSVWERAQRRPVLDEDDRVLSEAEAAELADPAGALAALLDGATLLADEAVTWEGQPARRLLIRPVLPVPRGREGPSAGEPGPLQLRLEVWLDLSGAPLAVERSLDFAAGPLAARQRQLVVLGTRDGRLVVTEMRETWSGRAVALLRGQDERRVTLRSVSAPAAATPAGG